MGHPAKYAKLLRGAALEYAPIDREPDGDGSFELAVTLGDMDLEDAFRVPISPSFPRLRAAELLDRVFSQDERSQEALRASFDLKTNPDLPEMYDALVEAFEEWKSHRCELRFFRNYGPEIALTDAVLDHLRLHEGSRVLDLVIEQRYTPLEYAVRRGHYESRAQLLEWLQLVTMLYFVDQQGLDIAVETHSETEKGLWLIAERLLSSGLLSRAEGAAAFEVTEEGHRLLASSMAEAESYMDRYEVFGDVLYDFESGAARFGTGSGDDIRVPVYEAEGLDPLRVVLLRLLYDSELDGLQSDWRLAAQDEELFDQVLAPVVDHQSVEESLLEGIIESGFAFVEELEDEEFTRRDRERSGGRSKGSSVPC